MLKLKMFVLGTLVTACMTAAWAQTGSIQGVVKDNSGAVIQGADVIVRNIETNAHRSGSTSSTGVYSVPNLPVGHYEITAKKDSFKAYHLDDIQLTVAQTPQTAYLVGGTTNGHPVTRIRVLSAP